MLDLCSIAESIMRVEAAEKTVRVFTEKEKYFIAEIAYRTKDIRVIEELILLLALNLYRAEEEKTVQKLTSVLNAYGVALTAGEIKIKEIFFR